MLKDIMWKTFENTGNINSYMFFKELSYIENGQNREAVYVNELKIGATNEAGVTGVMV